MRNVSELVSALAKRTTSKALRGFVIFLSFVSCASSMAQASNSGFEYGVGNVATGWNKFGNAFREAIQPRSGSYSMKLFGNFTGGSNVTGVYQDLPVGPGVRVAASAWAINRQADAMSGDNYAVLKIIFRDALNNDLLSAESNRITFSTPKDTYRMLSVSLAQAPLGTHHCSVFILFVQPASTPFASGSTLFDDLRVSVLNNSNVLVWQDEFNGASLNLNNWEPMIGDGTAYGLNAGWGNNELQYYTSRPENVQVSGGNLHIVARKENYQGRQYTSARLRTKGKHDFLYGRIEARIKVPAGQGFWPAFWMLPSTTNYGGWASSGEIDIMETVNSATTSYGTIHFGGTYPSNVQSGGSKLVSGGLASNFHVFRIDWDPDEIRWSVDGVQFFAESSKVWYSSVGILNERAPFDNKFHILLNLAVGGNWPGNPNAGTVFPSEMLVDWVRVYTRATKSDSKID